MPTPHVPSGEPARRQADAPDVPLDAGTILKAEAEIASLKALAGGNTLIRGWVVEAAAKWSDPPATGTPAGKQQAEGGTPKPDAKPDGPFDSDGFRFAGVDVRFGKAGKQYRLVTALWDAKTKRPAEPQPIENVIAEVWGDDNETEDSAFRQLCADTRARFQKANCPLDIRQVNGKVQLSPL
jgi:hypothetical protein